jgi:hypothetical protein
LRALIEGICKDKAAKGDNLKQRICALAEMLPKNIVGNLHVLRELCNTAVHELNPPASEALRLAVEISEDIMDVLYDLVGKTGQLRLYGETGSMWPEPPKLKQ